MDRPVLSVQQAAESLLPSCVASPVGRPSSPGCGTPMTPLSGNAFTFCDMDLLESGGARITLSSSHLRPQCRKQKKFRSCLLKRHKEGGGEEQSFWLYDEKRHEFMLSAKKIGTSFYISQYEDFPAYFDGDEAEEYATPKSSYCCILRLDTKSKVYRLFNRSCEGCDAILAKHTCGPRTRINSDRQLLAEVRHTLEPVACGDSWTDCNATKVKIPNIYEDMSRDVWCLRQMAPVQPAISPGRALRKTSSAPVQVSALPKGKDDGVREESDPRVEEDEQKRFRLPVKQLELQQMVSPLKRYTATQKKNHPVRSNQEEEEEEEEKEEENGPAHPETVDDEGTSDGSTQGSNPGIADMAHSEGSKKIVCGTHNGACFLKTRVPRYDINSGTLRMKFYNQRVRQSSSKNMIFTLPFEDGEGVLSDKEGAILQFGKLSPGSYSLDFSFPLAPVQALGICLSLFNWQIPTK